RFVVNINGRIHASDGSKIKADEKINGGPSVLFDAVAVLTSREGAMKLAMEPSARDFVADAYAHCKFVGYNALSLPLFEKAGLAAAMDNGFIQLKSPTDAGGFISTCRRLRLWAREEKTKMPG
ncbi:MAG TPA: catalase HPII, partial [Candidatus Melainabacteria bacterium]|nr:catalase HPII [Candidatus Melainabacteria bacterium]